MELGKECDGVRIMENRIEHKVVIWMTMILSLLILPLYLLSYNQQNWFVFVVLFIFERFAAPFTGKNFDDAIEQVGDLLEQDLNQKEFKKVLGFLVTLIAFVIVMIRLYIYILFDSPLLFTFLMIAELIDKGIEKFIFKRT